MGNQLERKGGSLSCAQVLECEISRGLYRILASVTMLTHSVLGSLAFPYRIQILEVIAFREKRIGKTEVFFFSRLLKFIGFSSFLSLLEQ
jgi:hypothetical protein